MVKPHWIWNPNQGMTIWLEENKESSEFGHKTEDIQTCSSIKASYHLRGCKKLEGNPHMPWNYPTQLQWTSCSREIYIPQNLVASELILSYPQLHSTSRFDLVNSSKSWFYVELWRTSRSISINPYIFWTCLILLMEEILHHLGCIKPWK